MRVEEEGEKNWEEKLQYFALTSSLPLETAAAAEETANEEEKVGQFSSVQTEREGERSSSSSFSFPWRSWGEEKRRMKKGAFSPLSLSEEGEAMYGKFFLSPPPLVLCRSCEKAGGQEIGVGISSSLLSSSSSAHNLQPFSSLYFVSLIFFRLSSVCVKLQTFFLGFAGLSLSIYLSFRCVASMRWGSAQASPCVQLMFSSPLSIRNASVRNVVFSTRGYDGAKGEAFDNFSTADQKKERELIRFGGFDSPPSSPSQTLHLLLLSLHLQQRFFLLLLQLQD